MAPGPMRVGAALCACTFAIVFNMTLLFPLAPFYVQVPRPWTLTPVRHS